jgi:general secretion pathway protein K
VTVSRKTPQRGVALLGAVLLAAIATVLAVAWLDRLNDFAGRTGGMLEEGQADLYVAGMEAWAVATLRRDHRMGAVDHLGEAWARPARTLPVPGGTVAGTLVDLQGRFNLNTLVAGGQANPAAIALFKRLLLRLELPGVRPEAVVDWIDPDSVALPGGGEDAFYLRAEPPYRPANAPLASVQELRGIVGVDSAALARLAPHVTVLPEQATVNVNTASPLLLEVLSGGGEALARRRLQSPFASLQDWIAAAPGTPEEVRGLAGVGSDFFLLETTVTVRRSEWHYQTELWRKGERVSVLRRMRRMATDDRLVGPSSDG